LWVLLYNFHMLLQNGSITKEKIKITENKGKDKFVWLYEKQYKVMNKTWSPSGFAILRSAI